MKLVNKLFIGILIFSTSIIGFSQTICEPVTEDLKLVLSLVFEPELREKDSIVLRYNFKTVCMEEAFDRSKIKLWSEKKLLDNLYQDFYSLEDVQITYDQAKVIYLQRNNNLIFTFLLYKEDGNWQISNKKFKRQGRIKGDDYLLLTIRKVLEKN